MGARALAAALVLLLAAPAWGGGQVASIASGKTVPLGLGEGLGQGRPCRGAFRVQPWLSHVTTTAIRINMIPENAFDLKVTLSLGTQASWGVAGAGVSTNPVIQAGATADTRTHLVAAPTATFTGLTAGTEYKYLVECRASSTAPWQMVSQSHFKTLHTNAAAEVRAIVVGDDHTTSVINQTDCQDDRVTGLNLIASPLGRTLNRSQSLKQAIHNMAKWGGDFLVTAGDTAMPHHGETIPTNAPINGRTNCDYITRDGVAIASTAEDAATQAESESRWHQYLEIWQPLIQHLPIMMTAGNHEGMTGWGGLGATEFAGFSQNEAVLNTAGFLAAVGNLNDAYDNTSDVVDHDGDGAIESQKEGLYYEFASGSLRWFITDSMRYTDDSDNGGGLPAGNEWPGFVARTADWPPAVFSAVLALGRPSNSWPGNGTDTYEDNATMGATQTAWFVARAALKTEAFGVMLSHRPVGGMTPGAAYFYQRGLLATNDDNADGLRLPTETLDADGDGDVMDEKYILDTMIANAIQIRMIGHDHFHQICRKSAKHYILVGQPSCTTPNGDSVTPRPFGACTPNWIVPTSRDDSVGDEAYFDIYDCDGDGFPDADRLGTGDATDPRNVINQGTSGTNATLNRGFGVLVVNGATSMTWKWIVRDPWDSVRDNDVILTYGPILP